MSDVREHSRYSRRLDENRPINSKAVRMAQQLGLVELASTKGILTSTKEK